jgi:hypothetical protein
VTKQQEAKTEEAKFAAQAAAAGAEQERVRWEAQGRFAQEEAQRKAQLAQYEDELARKWVAPRPCPDFGVAVSGGGCCSA